MGFTEGLTFMINLLKLIHKFFVLTEREKFREAEGPVPLAAIFSARIFMIAQIRPAQAQACANRGLLLRGTRLATQVVF